MNTYHKFMPNVFLAKCTEKHQRGEVIPVTTRYGKENESIVFNLIFERDGHFYYSIIRNDGMNAQTYAAKKAERINGFASNADKRSDEAYNSRASKHELEFMALGEPIKIGHHSERRHRKLFEKYDNKMRKSIEEKEKAEDYRSRAEYWEGKSKDINISMPESIEYFQFKLEQAEETHRKLKSGEIPRQHSYSLTYAKKDVNTLKKQLEVAVKLWD